MYAEGDAATRGRITTGAGFYFATSFVMDYISASLVLPCETYPYRCCRHHHSLPRHLSSDAPASGLSAISARSCPVIINAANYSANSLAYLTLSLSLFPLSPHLSNPLARVSRLFALSSLSNESTTVSRKARKREREKERGRNTEETASGRRRLRKVPLYRPPSITCAVL